MTDLRGPPPLTENLKDLYANGITFDEHLPIAAFREEIVRKIAENPVLLVHGATGCGKTTQIAQYILDDCIRKGQMPYIVVTQPRRIAAVSIARHVCNERRWEFGGLVGYQIGQDSLFCDTTRILYCTLGVFLEKLACGRGLDQMTHVVLDEMHEREEEMDLALLLIKKIQQGSRNQIKLIVMSATMEIGKFVTYLGGPPVIEIATGMFDVDIKYLEDLTGARGEDYGFSRQEPRVEGLVQTTLLNLVASLDKLENDFGSDNKSKGVVLIFAPGMREIVDLMTVLEQSSRACGQNWDILPLHSTVSRREQDRVFAYCPSNVRRVIVSTNIAESSVTIPDVKYVIDLCLTKQLTRDESSAFTALRLTWASKSNCDQRKGRAGRLSTGTVYRMVPRMFYEELDAHQVPEMLRIPLHQTILKVKALNIPGDIYEILREAVDAPDPRAIRQSILELMEAGALSLPENCTSHKYPDGTLTSIGRMMSSLPLDLPLKRLIILAISFGCVDEAIIIAGCLQSRSFLDVKFQQQNLESYKMKMIWDKGGHSDLLAVLRAFQAWESQKCGVFGKNKIEEEKKWCSRHCLSYPRINEAAILVEEIRRRIQDQGLYARYHPSMLSSSKWVVPVEEIDERFLLQFVIAGAFYPNYFVTEAEKSPRGLPDKTPPVDPDPRTVFLAIGVDPKFVSVEGVKKFFHQNIGFVPDEVTCDDMRVWASFRKDEDSSDPDVPLSVYLALRLKHDRDSRISIRRVIPGPTSGQGQIQPNFLPRSVTVRQKETLTVTPKYIPVDFTGPFSELEVLSFRGITPDVRLRKVRISKSSVNSVVVNTSKDTRISRLLVAATVKAGEGYGQTLTVENTTLLPAERGLLDMVLMVFAPSVLLVHDNRQNKYTGYKGGVGKRKMATPLPLWKDHDIDRSFEVDFTEEQISAVLALREWWPSCFADHLMKDAVWRHKILPKLQNINRRMLCWLLSQEFISPV